MQSSTIDKLKGISFFAEMSEYDLGQIAEITEEKNYAKGDVIIEERTSAERFFIICKGKIEITKQFEDGEEFVLAVHSDGDFFGEMALLDEGLRSATARAGPTATMRRPAPATVPLRSTERRASMVSTVPPLMSRSACCFSTRFSLSSLAQE